MPTTMPRLYRPLSPAEVQAGLRALTDWHGDTRRIARTVRPADLWSLLERVATAETDLDHHTVVDLDAGTVTFALWTHSCDAVTDADLVLAERIDTIVAGL